ncbi:type II secretion system F family protein [Rubrivirga sp.]|uniref:type II secretion system F family protein n=1 Tax=Rubrivirga sp. TaxID=1885344 RepID=UPI003C782B6B
MAEFRFNGVAAGGQSVQGTVYAPNKKTAEKKVASLSEKHAFTLRDLEERMLFRYKVKNKSGELVKGEQKAYAEDEITKALERMGLEVVSVKKSLLNIQRKPPTGDVIMFVRLAANLLMEKMAFTEVMNLLMSDISSKSLKQVLRDISSDLKGGTEAKQAFMKHQDRLGKFTAYMLGVASQSGNMAEIYEATARFLERRDEFKKSVRSSLIMPSITIFATIGVFIWYVWYIVPETAGLFASFEGIELPPLTTFSLAMSAFLDKYMGVMGVIFLILVIAFVAWARTPKGQFVIDKNVIRIPVIGQLLHKLNIEVFCRVFAILYSGSGENLEVIKVAAEASGNRYMEHQVKTITIPAMMTRGAGLVESLEASGVFTQMTLSRFKTGAETGAVRKSAQQMADYYERETTLKLKTAVETIQTFVGLFIGVMVAFLTVLSAETALIRPSSSEMMGTGA